ncbi:hypothetical protein Ahy_A03g016048 [Arachis hypogaea]|uniref:Aminotransferase-like plant mobile domain-containing protein n=1 Tax=Arachis hypogaea TaxID=3818 RepID=A0A445E250_ARAHY|nr:hypothetical protein Ahy_A03g016048 [Arachis hypogaea]
MPLDSPEDGVIWYARCYILYLLGGVLLPDKANNTVHVRYLSLLANYDAISTYDWGSAILCWLYRVMCLATDYNVEGMAGCHTLLMSWIYYRLLFWAPDVTSLRVHCTKTQCKIVAWSAIGNTAYLHHTYRFGPSWGNPFAINRLGFRNNFCFLTAIIINLIFIRRVCQSVSNTFRGCNTGGEGGTSMRIFCILFRRNEGVKSGTMSPTNLQKENGFRRTEILNFLHVFRTR